MERFQLMIILITDIMVIIYSQLVRQLSEYSEKRPLQSPRAQNDVQVH